MRLPLLPLVLLAACSSAPPPPPPPCAGARLDPITLPAGGRAEIPLDAALSAELTSVTASSGITAWRDGERIVVRAGYEASGATLTATCTTGELSVPVTVEALSMTPLAQWDASNPEAPPAREYFAWWVGQDRAVYLYGGFVFQPRQFTPSTEAYRFDLTTLAWSRLTASGDLPPPGGRVDAAEGTLLYFGGGAPAADGSLNTPPTLRAVSAGPDGASFTTLDATGTPGSYTGAFVHDAARDRWLSICGADTGALGIHCGVHAYTSETGFTALDVAGPSPTGRYGFHYALDAANDRVIVFAGQTGAGPLDIGGDTWALELAGEGAPRWVQLFSSSEGIAARRNGAYAFDPESARLFVWGGTADGRTAVPGLEVLELDRGHERWVHVALGPDVPPRASGGAVLDAVGHRVLFGFGNEARLYTDLYALALHPRSGL